MSVALMITRPRPGQPQPDRRAVPIASEERYWKNWHPVILKEKYLWLPLLGVGLDVDAENLPEVLAELHKLQAVVPHYHSIGSEQYQQMAERLAVVIEELEAINSAELVPGGLDVWLG